MFGWTLMNPLFTTVFLEQLQLLPSRALIFWLFKSHSIHKSFCYWFAHLFFSSKFIFRNPTVLQTSTGISVLCVSSLAAVLASVWFWKKKSLKGVPKPQKWVKVGTVSKLIIYPVKSCSGVIVETAVLTHGMGLKCKD